MGERLPRKLAAILYADVAGYSRLMGEDEDATHETVRDYLDLASAFIESHHGEVAHYAGDAILARFDAVVDALSAAAEIQRELENRNDKLPHERRVKFRIGINSGDVIEDRGDIYGDGVNVAARLEALAEPGGVCISDAIRTAIGTKLPFRYAFIGEHSVKNIREPVRAYRVFEQSDNFLPAGSESSDTGVKQAHLPFGKPSIAIKPFQVIGAEAEQERLGDLITNGVSVALTRVPALVIVHDESPLMVQTKQLTAEELGKRFEVRYVLTGVVQKFGKRIRVTAELSDASSGRNTWAENIDRELRDPGDLFDIQDQIIEEIVTALNVKLLYGEAARVVRRALQNPAALDLYYRGEDLLWHSTMKLEFQEAHRLFEQTMQLEPDSPVGYAALALTHWVEVISGWSETPSQSLERAMELAREAIRLDDVTGYAHMVLAHTHLMRREYDEAMSEATRAVSDRPSCPAAYSIKASVLTYLDRAPEAVEFAEYALRLTPVYAPLYPAVLASACYGCGRYEEAIAAAREAIELMGTDVSPYLLMAASLCALGRSEEAQEVVAEVSRTTKDFDLADFAASQPYQNQETLDRLIDRLNTAGFS